MKRPCLFLLMALAALWESRGAEIAIRAGENVAAAFDRAQVWRRDHQAEKLEIVFRKGEHVVLEEIRVGRDLCGNGGVIIRGERGACLLGGAAVVGGWTRGRFNGRDDVWSAKLPDGAPADGELMAWGGRMMTSARWPNFCKTDPFASGWAHVPGKKINTFKEIPGEKLDEIVLGEDRGSRWTHPEEARVLIFPRHVFLNDIVPVATYCASNKTLKTARKLRYAARPVDRFFVEGLREELDAPGEWYCDRNERRLYFITPNGEDPNGQTVVVPTAKCFFRIKGVRNVRIEGLDMSGSFGGVVMEDCVGSEIVGCTLHDMCGNDGCAIRVKGGTHCSVRDCDISHVGTYAVTVEAGLPSSLEPCGHRIENNYIHHTGTQNRCAEAIMVWGQGTRIAHNLIHDTGRYGISCFARFCDIEFNRIRHVNLESTDTACIYVGGYHYGVGTRVRWNHVSDSVGFGHAEDGHYYFSHAAMGLYIDEACGGVEMSGNLVEDSGAHDIHLHNARYCTVTNNVLLSWAFKPQISITGWKDLPEGKYYKVRRPRILGWWKSVVSANPRWREYPSLAEDPLESSNPDGTLMKGTVVSGNLVVYPGPAPTNVVRMCNYNELYNAPLNNEVLSASDHAAARVLAETEFRRRVVLPEPIGLVRSPYRPDSFVKEEEGAREHPEWIRRPKTTWRPKEKWRGFNLLGMFRADDDGSNCVAFAGAPSPGRFSEEEFAWVRELGFNFVRLPMDYRFWTKPGDWLRFEESGLRKIDEAVAWGRKYGIHVQLCLHRAPGYCVADPNRDRPLFREEEPQRAFVEHWRMLARRYKGIPNDSLSFNLVNEPSYATDETCGAVEKRAIDVIQAESPGRFVVADGLGWGRLPVRSLYDCPFVGQAARGYDPVTVTHYRQVNQSGCTALPVWPLFADGPCGCWTNGTRLVLKGLPACSVSVAFGRPRGSARFSARSAGALVASFVADERREAPVWNFGLPNGSKELEIVAEEVDGLVFPGGITVRSPDGRQWATLGIAVGWEGEDPAGWFAMKRTQQRFLGFGRTKAFRSCEAADAGWERYDDRPGVGYFERHIYALWNEPLMRGQFCMVGEFGVAQATPHKTALAYLADMKSSWDRRGLGWAMWNLRGAYGIIDSGRADVQYEDFHGHKLDRKMLDVLRGGDD